MMCTQSAKEREGREREGVGPELPGGEDPVVVAEDRVLQDRLCSPRMLNQFKKSQSVGRSRRVGGSGHIVYV